MIYNIEKRRKSAIKSLQNKRKLLYADVKAGKYKTILTTKFETGWVEMFESYCDSIRTINKEELMLPVSHNFKSLNRAAHYYVYLETLIERLKQGEDPSIVIYEIVANQ